MGIATGAAFCNRQNERKRLIQNIKNGRHTWIMARRRYGKSSLVAQALLDLKGVRSAVRSATLDLLLTYDVESLDQVVRDSVGALAGRLLPRAQRPMRYLRSVFGSLRPEIVLGEDDIKIRLLTGDLAPGSLVDALGGLNRIASRHKRRAVLVFDEFQQLGLIKGHAPLEAAIRHAAQEATHVSYVFLGSQQHLLSELFENPGRPLYQLCERLKLQQNLRRVLRPVSRGRLHETVESEDLRASNRRRFRQYAPPSSLPQRPLWKAMATASATFLSSR